MKINVFEIQYHVPFMAQRGMKPHPTIPKLDIPNMVRMLSATKTMVVGAQVLPDALALVNAQEQTKLELPIDLIQVRNVASDVLIDTDIAPTVVTDDSEKLNALQQLLADEQAKSTHLQEYVTRLEQEKKGLHAVVDQKENEKQQLSQQIASMTAKKPAK